MINEEVELLRERIEILVIENFDLNRDRDMLRHENEMLREEVIRLEKIIFHLASGKVGGNNE